MNNYIKGTVREVFFKTDSGFMVGLFKVRYTEQEDLTDYLNKTITFTGTFPEMRSDTDYILYGNLVSHPKYGIQYKVESYEQIMPETKNGVIAFLSSGLFPKIGLKTATNIVDTLGDNALDLIIEDYHNLLIVPSLTEKRAKALHDILVREAHSYKTIIYLQNIGFTMNESSKVYNQYKNDTTSTIENNIYQVIEDIEGIGFPTVDKVAFNLNIKADDNKRIEACILYVMQDLCLKYGHTYNEIRDIYLGISNYLGIRLEEEAFYCYLSNLNKECKIIIENDRYYLINYYQAEINNALRIGLLTKKDNNAHPNIEAYIKKLQKKYNIEYNAKQKEAIEYSVNSNFLIITGGPGTGKTTIIKAIVDLYKDINKLTDEKLLEDIALLAPTGRAAKRIKEATSFPAMTIHKFLKWNKETNDFGININNKSNVKFVIVDEVSMIDNFLLNNLLNGLTTNVKLILVGDHNQLPSVGPGQVLKDLIEADTLPVIALNELYRQQEKSYIISLAYEINKGEISSNDLDNKGDYRFLECNRQDIKDLVKTLCQQSLDKGFSYKNIQILIPMYKGVNGIDMMNNMLQTIFNPATQSKKELEYQGITYREGDKVLQVKNNNDLNISNGDIGIINAIFKKDGKDKIAIDFDGDIVEYSLKEFDDVTLGYAISIHKSQGSEFDIVIIPMDISFARMLYRKLIYTAVTRAKKNLFLVGEKEAFIRSVKNGSEEKRKTSLKEFVLNSF